MADSQHKEPLVTREHALAAAKNAARNQGYALTLEGARVEPHEFQRRRGWRWWICTHCYAPRSLHPRTTWVQSRPYGDNRYLSANAPHFQEGW